MKKVVIFKIAKEITKKTSLPKVLQGQVQLEGICHIFKSYQYFVCCSVVINQKIWQHLVCNHYFTNVILVVVCI